MNDFSPFSLGKHPSWSQLRQGFARGDFLPSISTALLCWFLTVIFSVSLSALIFRGPLEPWLSLGITMSLLTATLSGLAVTLLGSLPGTIAIPSDRTAPMLAILAASIAASFPPGTSSDLLLETCLAALMLTTLLTGILLALLGHYRLGRIVRFLPLPVVGGFMAGAGWLMVKGALTVSTDMEATWAHFPKYFSSDLIIRWAPALGLAVVLVLATRRIRHFLVIPTVVVSAVILFYGIDLILGVSFDQLRVLRWLPGPFPGGGSWHPLTVHLVETADWTRIFHSGNAIGTVLIVSATSLLMISSALELAANAEVDADQELEAAGVANLVSFVGGGLVGFHSLSITNLSIRIGPHSRWIGLLTAGGCALTLFIGPNLVSYLPVPVLSGLLLFLGLNFLVEWLFDAYRRMPRSDYLMIVSILVVMAWAGYLVGVGVGLVLAAGLFALRYSRVDIVRMELSGVHHRSNVDRTAEEAAFLLPFRKSLLILKLQGFIFFGTAHSLLHRIRVRANDSTQPPLSYVFLDFRRVTGIDSSTLLSFSKLLQLSRKLGFRIVFADVPPDILHSLWRDSALFDDQGFLLRPDLDHGLEWWEEVTLQSFLEEKPAQTPTIESLLENGMPDRPRLAGRIIRFFTRREMRPGQLLAKQGDVTRDLFLIEQGKVSALIQSGGEPIRLRTLGPGSVVGEIGLYLNLPRTASLMVDTKGIVWSLPPEALMRMQGEDPEAAAALHEFLARMVAGRLVQANQLLEATLR